MVDIVKVRLQSRPDLYPSAITAAKSIWKDEGPLAFYKVRPLRLAIPPVQYERLITGNVGPVDWNRRLCRRSILAIP